MSWSDRARLETDGKYRANFGKETGKALKKITPDKLKAGLSTGKGAYIEFEWDLKKKKKKLK